MFSHGNCAAFVAAALVLLTCPGAKAQQQQQPSAPALSAPSKDGAQTKENEPKGQEGYVESNVVSLVGRDGFRWQSKSGDFLFNPFTLVQTYMQANYVNNKWLNLADQDNVKDAGFGIGNALFGVAGKGFGRVSFNVTLNVACSGACLLNQAWADFNSTDAFRIRVGKFKTPQYWAYLVRVGQTQLPRLPASLTGRVNVPFGLKAVNPSIGTGFDTGAMVHGLVGNVFEYQAGIFNGEGSNVNTPTSTLSDDKNLPGLMYAARVAYMPKGPMAIQEGGADQKRDMRLLFGASTSYNVEANAESSNDFRAALQAAMSAGGLYWAAESYLLRMDFTERQRGEPSLLYWGAYSQMGYTFSNRVEPVLRAELFDRNSTDKKGVLFVPAVGVNYYIYEQNLKIQAMYQGLIRTRYRNDTEAHQDDNGMPDHTGVIQLQFAL